MRRDSLLILCAMILPFVVTDCGDDTTAPSTGTLRVTILTTGSDFDPDGYVCTIDGSVSRAVEVNGIMTFTGLEPGDHSVGLSGLSANCNLVGESDRSVSVVAGDTTDTTFDVGCSALPYVSISLRPEDWRMPVGEQVRFHALVEGSGDQGVTWSVSGIPGGNTGVGTIDGDGLYSAPVLVPIENPVTVRAASASDPAAFTESPVTITPDGEQARKLYQFWTPRAVDQGATDSLTYEVSFAGYPRFEFERSGGGRLAATAVRSGTYGFRFSAAEVLTGYEAGDLHNFVGYLNCDICNWSGRSNVFVNVKDANVPSVSVTELEDDVQVASHVVNIRYDDLFVAEPIPTGVLQRFYDFFPDDFDVVVVIEQVESNEAPDYEGVRNDIDGIGLSEFDNGSGYGSPARLQGLIHHPLSHFFDAGGPTTIRRLGHRWMVYLGNPILAAGVPNWPVSSMARGIMQLRRGYHFPFTVELVAGNVYELVYSGHADEFNDLELYLMGLLPADSVSTHVVFQHQTLSPYPGYQGVADSITIQDIVTVNGARNPGYQDSQRDFRMATIVLSAGRLLSQHEMAFFNHMAKRGEAMEELHFTSGFWEGTTKPFYLATGRRATLTTRIIP